MDEPRSPLPLTERPAPSASPKAGPDDATIDAVIRDFYARAARDPDLGPIFEAHVSDWPAHFARMHDFWSSALRRTGRYAGQPVNAHRGLPNLSPPLFDRWMAIFAQTVRDHCDGSDATAWIDLADRMSDIMQKMLGLKPR
jgi:hemoglobin